MPDQTLRFVFETQAQLAGVQQLNAELQKTEALLKSIGVQSNATSQATNQFTQAANQATQATRQAGQAATQASGAVGGLASSFNAAGGSFAKARAELITLTRELASGGNVTRTLGALIGALPIGFAAAGVGAFVLARAALNVASEIDKASKAAQKLAEDTAKLTHEWNVAAVGARTFADAANLAERGMAEVTEGFKKAAEAQEKLLHPGVAASIVQNLAQYLSTDVTNQIKARSEQLDQEAQKRLDNLNTAVKTAEADAATYQSRLTLMPVEQAIDATLKDINTESYKMAVLDSQHNAQAQEFYDHKKRIADLEELLGRLMNKQTQELNQQLVAEEQLKRLTQEQADFEQRIADEAALNIAYGNEDWVIQQKVAIVYDRTLAQARERYIFGEKATQLARLAASAEQQKLYAIMGQAAPENELNNLLLRAQTILQGIHQEQELIKNAPFMGIDEKSRALLQSYIQEIERLKQIRDEIIAKKASGAIVDDKEILKANQEIQKLDFSIKILQQDMGKLTLHGELQKWADSWGTATHQIADAIESSITTSLDAMNQALVTGKFNAQQLVQQLALLVLKLIEQLAIQEIMAAFRTREAAKSAAEGVAVAAANAPGAAAKSISQYGPIVGAVAAVAAVGAIIAAILGAYHEGGPIRRRRMHDGGLAPDESLIIAQQGEFMIQRSVAQRPGMTDFLMGLNESHTGGLIPRWHRGGRGAGEGGGFDPGWVEPADLPGNLGFWSPSPDSPMVQTFPASRGRAPAGGSFREYVDNPLANRFFNMMMHGYGTEPSFGSAAFGPTAISTFWVNYPGVGTVPMAVPIGGWGVEDILGVKTSKGTPPHRTQHGGGLIGRMHSGGSVAGAGRFGGGIHIYAFTDLKALTKHMGSREGQKIIFDTIKGRSIDLGIG